MKKVGLGLMAILMVMVLVVPVFASAPLFKDIEKHWARGSIEQAVFKGYVSGYPDGTFLPDKQVSRAEFIKMAVDALKLPHVQQGSPWYQPYVAASIEFGIHKESDFKTEYAKPLTRLEMVRLSVRAINSTDITEDSSFLLTAVEQGILTGMGEGDLAPQGTSTRAQAVSVIERVLTVRSGGILPVDRKALRTAQKLVSEASGIPEEIVTVEELGVSIYPVSQFEKYYEKRPHYLSENGVDVEKVVVFEQSDLPGIITYTEYGGKESPITIFSIDFYIDGNDREFLQVEYTSDAGYLNIHLLTADGPRYRYPSKTIKDDKNHKVSSYQITSFADERAVGDKNYNDLKLKNVTHIGFETGLSKSIYLILNPYK